MKQGLLIPGRVVFGLLVSLLSAGGAVAQQPAAGNTSAAEQSQALTQRPNIETISTAARPAEHPLMPALRWAYAGLENIRKIEDYSCTFIKRERVDGRLQDHEYFFCKVRHNPFSIYLYFLAPEDVRGQEVIYVEGLNDNHLVAHPIGIRQRAIGSVQLKPDGMIAMRGNRYPLTDAGILNLAEKLIEIGEQDTHFGECEVNFYQGAKLNGRTCTCIQVKHPVPRRNFRYYMARIFVDEELMVPIRYASWSWPKTPGGEPELVEEYTYLDLKLNNGYTDRDFDPENPEYNFK